MNLNPFFLKCFPNPSFLYREFLKFKKVCGNWFSLFCWFVWADWKSKWKISKNSKRYWYVEKCQSGFGRFRKCFSLCSLAPHAVKNLNYNDSKWIYLRLKRFVPSVTDWNLPGIQSHMNFWPQKISNFLSKKEMQSLDRSVIMLVASFFLCFTPLEIYHLLNIFNMGKRKFEWRKKN